MIIALYWAYQHYGIPYYVEKFLNFEMLKQIRGYLMIYVKKRYWHAVAAYMSVYIFASLLAFPTTSLLTIVGGFLFGTRLGATYTVLAATIGATCVFFLTRHLLGEILHDYFKERLKTFNDHMDREGHWYLLSLRFSPIIPFSIVNILSGLTNVNISTFIWTTFIGVIPGAFVYSFAGRQFSRMSHTENIFTPELFKLFLALMALSLIPIIFKRIFNKYRKMNQS